MGIGRAEGRDRGRRARLNNPPPHSRSSPLAPPPPLSARSHPAPSPWPRDPIEVNRPRMKSLERKVAAITGAGSGIGRALALELARSGAEVALADINERTAAETAEM